MKRPFIFIVAIIALLAVACDDTANAEAAEAQAEADEATQTNVASVQLDIEGMSCVNCAADIEEGFEEADGVVEGRIDFGERRAYVDYDADELSVDDVIAIVEERGYQATLLED